MVWPQICWRFRCITQPSLRRHLSATRPACSLSYEAHAVSLENLDAEHSAELLPLPLKTKRTPEVHTRSFESLGLHPPIVSALRMAYPSIQQPTKSQEQLIPAVLAGQDIFLQDQTGSGKSFGLVLALLNRTRAVKWKSKEPAITSIFIVPHRDLAYQFHHWVERMFAPAASVPSSSISSIAQVLVRDSRGSGVSLLHENPPHLLFATPQALMDVWREQPSALHLKTLSAIVVDEADYLVPTVDYSRRRPRNSPKKKQHAGETREFLDAVYGNNPRPVDDEYVPTERDRSPQLIISSATLPRHLVEYVSEESDWLNRDNWVSISGTQSSRRRTSSRVTHSVLVVSDDMVRNITGAVPSSSSLNELPPADEGTDDGVPEIDPYLVQKYAQTPSPFNQLALETVAMIFAAEVPRIALLVLPSTSPVQRAIVELRGLGVHAHGLDWLKDRGDVRSDPILLVSTWANTRGLDVGELSHVFVLGIPDGGTTAYVHIAGRVGRLVGPKKRGRGKVVMVVAPSEEEGARELLETINCEAVRLEVE
ncbi:P-loop containing nucleoside triphosphate hydrolase protein [Mycena capillaripes]|nr:P-loop containing nucleoside triphosphate hydrolase protein [Mycena capillaripes]